MLPLYSFGLQRARKMPALYKKAQPVLWLGLVVIIEGNGGGGN
jgi:hypothetical protein